MKTLFAIAVLLLAAAAVNCAHYRAFDPATPDEVEQKSKLEQLLAVMQGDDDTQEEDAFEMEKGMEKLVSQIGDDGEANMEDEDDDMLSSIQVAYNNGPDRPLNLQCNVQKGEAIYRIQSRWVARSNDRQFKFSCQRITPVPITDCMVTPYLNAFDAPLGYTCPADYVVTGIQSIHLNSREDRRWKLRCCRAKGYHTESCELTKDFINAFRGNIDFSVKPSCTDSHVISGSAFTGLYSFDNNKQHDRRWKIYECQYKKN